ncbi:MAG TPA: DUF2089 family protein [Chthonomonadaceae bacterium]|nr:DUF2089 family protein [Chthonomonadaceae bacterium]
MAKALSRCPVCEATLSITELACARCQTRIQSTFDPCRFCRLEREQLAFIELFLRCEGNLSRVEKELNLSYPTVRNRLAAALAALGLNGEVAPEIPEASAAVPPTPEAQERRRVLLEALARGDMSAEEVAGALRDNA